jgi:uncharacterized lipoprotein YddW (UPF0748 family)
MKNFIVLFFIGIILAAITNGAGFAEKPMLEARAVWFEKAEMVEPKEDVLSRLDRMADAGLNTICLAMQIRGYVMHPGSEIIPQWEGARQTDPDLLDWFIPAIHERGMKAEAWTEFGFYTYHTYDANQDPSRGPVLDKHPELVAIDAEGRPYLHNEQWGDFYSLCPANPKSHRVLIDLYVEMMDRYPFDGLNLDRIRFPAENYCYCPYCREHVKKEIGVDLEQMKPGTQDEQRWTQWKEERLYDFMKNLNKEIHNRRPEARITSAVVPPDMMEEKAQDWPTWLDRGWLDAAMPMLYREDIGPAVEKIQEMSPQDALIFYGLDAGQGWETLSEQIQSLRRLKAPGMTFWYSKSIDPFLPKLKETYFSRSAVSPVYLDDQPGPVKKTARTKSFKHHAGRRNSW